MKIRVRDILFALVSLASFMICGTTLYTNLTSPDETPTLMSWYLSLSMALFMVIAVLAILESLCHTRLVGLKKALYGADMAIATVYTLLVVIDASPLIAEFIAKELWRSAIGIMTFSIYVIYILIGILTAALCFNQLRGAFKNQRTFGITLMIVTVLSVIPTVMFSFQYTLDTALHTEMITTLLAPVVLQALSVYPAFCTKTETE